MNTQDYNKFLHKLYDILIKDGIINYDREVSTSKEKTERIKKYLGKLDRVQNKALDNNRYLDMIKKLYYDKYLIKEEDIPVSYLKMLEKKYLDLGRGHVDLVSPKTIADKNLRKEHINTIIREQKESLDGWLNYLLSFDASYLDVWTKVWAFQGMLSIGTLNSDRTSYLKRDKNTVAPFVEIDSEILGKCTEFLKHSLNRENIEDVEINELVKSNSFSKLYGKLLLSKKKIRLNGNDGIWIKYHYETEEEAKEKEKNNMKPEYLKLYESLQGYNTGWCTAVSSETAREQICGGTSYIGGDFYVYYSIDENKEYKIPRIAIRMDQNDIGEIRGIAENKNIEPDMEDVLKEKLKEFPNVKSYQKKVEDMKRLTTLYSKYLNKQELTKDELSFLYEIDDEIIGFGYYKDPRIEEILLTRDKRKDLSLIFNCREDEMGFDESDLERKLIYFYGDLTLNRLTSLKGTVLPQRIRGDLDLNGLTSADGFVFPKSIGGSLYLYSLTSLKGSVLPESIGGNLDLYSLICTQGLVLPENIGGNLYLNRLISIKELTLPNFVGGRISYKNHDYSLEELKELQREEEKMTIIDSNDKGMKKIRKMGYASTISIIISTLLISLIGIIIGNMIVK